VRAVRSRQRRRFEVCRPERNAIQAIPAFPPVIGHRGAAGCAPENTLAGLRRAAVLACRWVEFDVRLTADGEPILLHDERLDRTTDRRGKAMRLPLAAIRRCDAGSWFAPAFSGEGVPTLAEAVALLAELGLGANIELKSNGSGSADTGAIVGRALDLLWPPHLPAPLISSFLPEALMRARYSAPQFPRAILFRSIPRDWRQRVETLGCVAVHADHRRLDPAVVAEIRDQGYSVLAYTVNDPMRARALLTWGVASVFSDVPHIILAAAAGGSSRRTVANIGGPAAIPRRGAIS
jgi:glycerophosphoryl diester phosphodiesterase